MMTSMMPVEITLEATAPRMASNHVKGMVIHTQIIDDRHETVKIDFGERMERNPMSMTCAGSPRGAAIAIHETRYANSMNFPAYNKWKRGFAARLTATP